MPWARLDDKFWGHPKIVNLPHAAVGLYALGLSYAAGNLTDGILPKNLVIGWRDGPAVKALVQAGLWQITEEGFRIHDYLDWNASREQVLAERAAAAKRMNNRRSSGEHQAKSGRSSPERSGEVRLPHTTLSTSTGMEGGRVSLPRAHEDPNLPAEVLARLARPPILPTLPA